MFAALTFEQVLWGTAFLLNAGLVVLLGYRKNHRVFPFFFTYVLLNLLQGILLFEIYRVWGFSSSTAVLIGWGTQVLVMLARALAIAEICHRVLSNYRGVWKLARILLIATAAIVAVSAWALSHGNWRSAILSFDRGLELAIASALVILFGFARYYNVSLEPAVSTVAVGFFLYSGFRVLNNTIAERWLTHSTMLWNLFGTISFIASLLLWTWAMRQSLEKAAQGLVMLSEDHYRSLSPAINARLRTLNEQLSRPWYAEGGKS